MPRADRICFSGAVYHIIHRGNNKQNIFVDDTDRWHLLKLFLEAKKKFECLIHCYALMHNHFHATIETPNAIPVSKIMQQVGGSYAAYFNKRHDKKGHLFQGRFKDIIVDKENYLLELSRYVHLNPVKAGFSIRPEEHKWSSYGVYIGEHKDALVTTSMVLSYFDMGNKEAAEKEYKKFVESKLSEISSDRDWLKENLIRKRFLGSRDFFNNFKEKKDQALLSKKFY